MYSCDECGGQGAVIIDISKGITDECPVCNGTGEVEN
jgi:DnaJ-class molecular chaperone